MAEKKYFPSQAPEEKIFLLIRKHWFNYIIFIFLAVLMLVPVIGIAVYLVANGNQLLANNAVFLVIVAAIILLLTFAIELYGFINYYLDVYIVTDRRLVDISQNGLFNRDISELQIRQVQDVSAHVEGFFNTLLHFGDVHIQTAGERENFIFTSIPHPYAVSKQIVDLHETATEDEDLSLIKKYDEDQLEKGLEIEQIEEKAKELLTDPKTVTHQARGVYIPKSNKAAIETFSKEMKSGADTGQEHELKEGEESKIPK